MLTKIEQEVAVRFGVSSEEFVTAKLAAQFKYPELKLANQLTTEEAAVLNNANIAPEAYLNEKQILMASKVAEFAIDNRISDQSGLTENERQVLAKTGISLEEYLKNK